MCNVIVKALVPAHLTVNGNLIEDYDTADFKHNVAMSSNESTGVFTFSATGPSRPTPRMLARTTSTFISSSLLTTV